MPQVKAPSAAFGAVVSAITHPYILEEVAA